MAEPAAPEKAFLGYNFTCAIDGNVIPQRLQNLCIRDYAQSKRLPLSFNVAEYSDARRALMLFAQFDIIDTIAGFIFFSLLLLPADGDRRNDFYARVGKAGKPVHFALEDLVMKGPGDRDWIERMYRITVDKRLDETRHALIALASR